MKSLVLSLVLTVTAAATPAADLVSRWQFDQQQFRDGQFAALAGTMQASPNGGLQFDKQQPNAMMLPVEGKASHIRVVSDMKNAELPADSISVEAWVRIDKPQEWGGIIGVIQDNGDYERGWLLGFNQSSFYFAISSKDRAKFTYLKANELYQPGYWYHVVGTYDGREQRVYVDGRLQARSQDQRGAILYSPKGFYTIGAYHDDNELYSMTGSVEQISVWSGALDEKEVSARFRQRKNKFPEIDRVKVRTADWPTYLRDNLRTGMADSDLQLPLKLAWHHKTRHPPKPAWPPPANQDFWHKKHGLKARVTYDRFFHLISAGDHVYFASSADDQVRCLDAKTGKVQWRFFAEAPVRLAPTIAGNRVLFGSDDGAVYCLNAASGEPIWKHRERPVRWIAGNGRLVSDMPVRSGVLIDEQVGFFCAGLFPAQGVTQVALNVVDGSKLADGKLQISAQGYLERRAGRMFVATGRDPAGQFVATLKRRGKDASKEILTIPTDYAEAFIGAGNQRIGGGDGRLAIFDAQDGKQLWSAEVNGRAGSLAVARDRLYVSTDTGDIYCFQSNVSEAPLVHEPQSATSYPYVDASEKAAYENLADSIVKQVGKQKGYALVIDCGRGQILYELARRTKLQLIGIESNTQKMADARQRLADANLYGRIVIHESPATAQLPYTDYLFNLVVRDSLADEPQIAIAQEEIQRVLRPSGGVAMYSTDDAPFFQRGELEGAGRWTHLYGDAANTACSGDARVGSGLRLQWFGRPGPQRMLDRHHRTVSPLSNNGRLFVPGDNRVIAVDAYNGTILWDLEVPEFRRAAAVRDCGSMAINDRTLFVASAGDCWEIDAQSGTRRATHAVPSAPDDTPRDWGFTACVGELLYGSATSPGASRRGHSLQTINEGTYWDFKPVVTSDALFAIDSATKKLKWKYSAASGAILNPTITIGGGRMYFIENRHTKTIGSPNGRVKLTEALAQPAHVVALDRRTGAEMWRKELDLSAIEHHLFAAFSNDVLALVGSRNDGTNKKNSKVWYDLHALDARSGAVLWHHSQNNKTQIGGEHGEQDHHPVIVGKEIYTEPFAYDLKTGKPVEWGWNREHRRGCGTISASACAFFFRDRNSAMFDLLEQKHAKVTQVTRPGCWINMIPACGLLLIPEASSGCTCDFAVQTSLAFLPDDRRTKEKATER